MSTTTSNATYTQTVAECPVCGQPINATVAANVTISQRLTMPRPAAEIRGTATGATVFHRCGMDSLKRTYAEAVTEGIRRGGFKLDYPEKPAKTLSVSTSATETPANVSEAPGEGDGENAAPEWQDGDAVVLWYPTTTNIFTLMRQSGKWGMSGLSDRGVSSLVDVLGRGHEHDPALLECEVDAHAIVLRNGKLVTDPSTDRELESLRATVARAQKLADERDGVDPDLGDFSYTINECGQKLAKALRDGGADE